MSPEGHYGAARGAAAGLSVYGGGVYGWGVPPTPVHAEAGSITARPRRNGPLGSMASRGAPYKGIQGIHGNTGNTGIQGIHGNTGYTGIQGIQGIHGNTWEYTEYTGIPVIHGNTGNTALRASVILRYGPTGLCYTKIRPYGPYYY